MELGESEIRAQNELRLEHFRAFAALPDKMPALLEIYVTAGSEESEEQTVRRIGALFDCSDETAFAIHNCQLLKLHPKNQQAIRHEIEDLERYLGS